MSSRNLGLMILLVACGCGSVDGGDKTLTKSEAKALVESGDADDAVCSEHGFNDDGECDDWCPDGDVDDCPVSDTDACEEGDTKSADDGCNTCTCSEGGWACTEMACAPDNNGQPSDDLFPLTIGDCPAGSDPVQLGTIALTGDVLEVPVGYSGGCADHDFTFCWDGTFQESFPVQAQLALHHNANGDSCEAWGEVTLRVSLDEMKDAYAAGYQDKNGTIIVKLEGQSVDYTF